ncbi:MAG: sulfurtransferase TusA family protein [Candidatus Heimdallarchaeaceae archaeon]|uniref:Sulfurtransferase TusA family protein n=1 Tax=Candidatus Heimdallarchaeum endolithica TaxID=2876572 RepID=A0A9Y1FPX6_9ARCH|nr:MAG: sulfurtransferase TusA family protein [Candidatus Heimdallarchaeum endolithica]
MSENKVTTTLDVKGLNCPLPILKTKKAINEIKISENIKVIATDPGSVNDFQAWIESTGHELVESTEENGIFRYLIKKTK